MLVLKQRLCVPNTAVPRSGALLNSINTVVLQRSAPIVWVVWSQYYKYRESSKRGVQQPLRLMLPPKASQSAIKTYYLTKTLLLDPAFCSPNPAVFTTKT